MKKISDLSLLEREELFKTLRVSITHHSNALEGTTLNYGETKTLLESGKTADNKPIDEQLIILGFAQAYDVVIREANNKNTTLNSAFIKDLHYLLFANAQKVATHFVRKPIGAYRNSEAKIAGCDIELSLPHLISQEIENLLFRFPSNALELSQIAEFHAEFEKIHPFSDGNGRIGRLLMSFQCIQNDYIPPLIQYEDRERYLNCLNGLQNHNELQNFVDFLECCQKQSLDLIVEHSQTAPKTRRMK